jgi:superfamily II DNA or RNA helicase
VEHDEKTEVVIHVNKLKEGWDVTNLYTIVPLRASASEILTEQTIGRGAPAFGRRTGVKRWIGCASSPTTASRTSSTAPTIPSRSSEDRLYRRHGRRRCAGQAAALAEYRVGARHPLHRPPAGTGWKTVVPP